MGGARVLRAILRRTGGGLRVVAGPVLGSAASYGDSRPRCRRVDRTMLAGTPFKLARERWDKAPVYTAAFAVRLAVLYALSRGVVAYAGACERCAALMHT